MSVVEEAKPRFTTKSTTITKDFRVLSLRDLRVVRGSLIFVAIVVLVVSSTRAAAGQELPRLTQPVNDFANVIDPASQQAMDSLIRSLHEQTQDAVVVATVDTYAPYGDIREFANKLFENHGKGIGQRGKDNGVLVVLAVQDREVRIEVGYDLEQFITDGFAGEVSRQDMAPEFRRGAYGAGLLTGVSRIIGRIAERRGVTLQGVRPPRRRDIQPQGGSGSSLLVGLFVLFVVLKLMGGLMGFGRRRRFYRRGWGGLGGWHSGVGPFGGGGFGGGGFGGGFGGFGGGRSGGGGGGASW